MRLAVALASLFLLACPKEDDFPGGTPPSHNPPGDGDGPIDGGPIDAGADAAPPSENINGTVCEVGDVRIPTTCQTINGADVTVRLEGTDVTTTVDSMGRFTLPLQPGSGGERVVLSATFDGSFLYANAFATVRLDEGGGATGVKLRTIDSEYYESILTTNMLPAQEGFTGQVFVRLVNAQGLPLDDWTFSMLEGDLPYYDGGFPELFSQDAEADTGTNGFAAYLNALEGMIIVTATKGELTKTYQIPVLADGVSFYTAVFP
jgi:hypothetical protein